MRQPTSFLKEKNCREHEDPLDVISSRSIQTRSYRFCIDRWKGRATHVPERRLSESV